jgi:hypothetical protein
LTDSGLALGTMPSGFSYKLVDNLATSQVELQVVPEPGALALLFMAIATAGLWTCRRRHAK